MGPAMDERGRAIGVRVPGSDALEAGRGIISPAVREGGRA
jgi:hypothetical protein